MGTTNQTDTSSIDELYGPGAITGTVDDAKLNDVEIMSNGSSMQVQVKTKDGEEGGSPLENPDGNTDGTGNDPDVPPQEDGKETPDGDGSTEKDPVKERQELKESIEELSADLKGKGFDINAALDELETKGTLSDATYSKLGELGYPKAVIDGYVKAAAIVEAEFEKAVYSVIGTKEEYTQVLQWAYQNVPKADQDAFDAALDRGDMTTIKLYADNFTSKMGKVFGKGNPRVPGAPTVATTVEGFTTKKELTTATSDKRYGRDSDYTAEVSAKMLKTSWL